MLLVVGDIDEPGGVESVGGDGGDLVEQVLHQEIERRRYGVEVERLFHVIEVRRPHR